MTKRPVHPIVRQLRARRRQLGMTQQQVGAKCGVTQACVTEWESGSKNPGLHKLQLWANSLDMALTLMPLEGDW